MGAGPAIHRVQLEDIAAKAWRRFVSARIPGLQGAHRPRQRPRSPPARDGLRHADRREIRPATRCSNSPRHRFAWLGRPVELPGSRPLRFRVLAGYRLAAHRMAGRPLHQMPVLLPSGRPPRRSRPNSSRSSEACSKQRGRFGRELLVEIIAGKHGQSSTTPPFRAPRWRNSTRWASSPTGGSSSHRPRAGAWARIRTGDRQERSVVPRRCAVWGSKRRRMS